MALVIPLLAVVVIASGEPPGQSARAGHAVLDAPHAMDAPKAVDAPRNADAPPTADAPRAATDPPRSEADSARPVAARAALGMHEAFVLFAWSAGSIALLLGWRGWRPGALDGPAWRPSVGAGLAAAVTIVGAGVVGDAIATFAWPAALGGGGREARSAWSALAQVGAAAMVLALRRSIFQRSHGHPAGAVASAMGGAVGLIVAWPLVQVSMLAGSWLSEVLAGAEVPALAHESLRVLQESSSVMQRAMIAGIAIVAAPFIEEVLYRGVIQQMLRAAGLGPAASIVLCAALFSVMHLGDGAVSAAGAGAALPALFLLGVLFGVLFERTGRLTAPFTAHAVFNAVNVLMLMGQPSPTLTAP